MKKVIVLGVFSLFFIQLGYSQKVNIDKQKKGLFGYDIVVREYNPDTKITTIYCHNPGLIACKFHNTTASGSGDNGTIFPEHVIPIIDDLSDLIDGKALAGELKGNITKRYSHQNESGGFDNYIIKARWKGKSNGDVNIEFIYVDLP
jgi:hypothetical protein